MARSFLKEMKLPSNLWGEAIRHTVYVLNRLPTYSLSEKTPYEAWKGSKPDLTHLRIFGCVAYMKVPSNQVIKLDDRSRKVIYLGREPGTKGCRLLDPDSGKILVSRDVVCDEGKSWTWRDQQKTETTSTYGTFSIFNVQVIDAETEDASVEPITPVQDKNSSGDSNNAVNFTVRTESPDMGESILGEIGLVSGTSSSSSSSVLST